MKIHLQETFVKFLLSFFLLIFTIDLSAQNLENCTFIEKDGILTVEMESGEFPGTYWVHTTSVPGYTGTGFLEYTGGFLTGVPGKSQVTYTFKINQPGRYSFKVRAFRTEFEDNDVWVRFPKGGVVTKYMNDSTGFLNDSWFKFFIGAQGSWNYFMKTQIDGYAHRIFHDVYVDFPEPGIYTVEFSGRSTGFKMDRFTLYKTSGFYGMNPENPESEKESCVPFAPNPYQAEVIPNQEFEADVPFSFSFPETAFIHPEGKRLGYAAYLSGGPALPSWLSFSPTTRTFSGNAPFSEGGEHYIIVKAQDGDGKYAIGQFKIKILGNNPPVVAAEIKDTVCYSGIYFTFAIPSSTFIDDDGDVITLSAFGNGKGSLPSWLSFDPNTFTFSGIPGPSAVDTIYVIAADGKGGETELYFLLQTESVQGAIYAEPKNQVQIYPNPVRDYFQVRNTSGGYLEILDITGAVVLRNEVEDMQKISINEIKPGVYTVRIISKQGGNIQIGRLVKN